MNNKDNPFYDNHIFNEADLHRAIIKWWSYPLLWFKPTYVQISEGYVYHYKLDSSGRIFMIKAEKLIDSN